MERKLKDKRIVIVSRFFFPNSSVDSVSVYTMSRYFLNISEDVEVHIVSTIGAYKNSSDFVDLDDETIKKLHIHRIKTISTFKSQFLNFCFGIIDGIRMAFKASRIPSDKIIFLTNPPLVVLFFNLLFNPRKLYYWAFDIYPDAFVADGIMSSKNKFYKLLNYLTYKKHPYNIIALGEAQFEYLTHKFQTKEINKIILPCGIHQNFEPSEVPSWHTNDKIILGYIGNIGRAHHIDFLLNIIDIVHEEKNFILVLSIYGHHSARVLEHVSELNSANIVLIKTLSQNQLKFIDVHLVSLNETWTNISVPSKAVSAICSGRPLWFCGSILSDTFQMFKDCSFYSGPNKDSILSVIKNISRIEIDSKSNNSLLKSRKLLEMEIEAYEKIIS